MMHGSRTGGGGGCRSHQRGTSLIEVLVATLIFAVAATALAKTLASAERARRTSDRWLTATQLAAERLERLRAGDRTRDEPLAGGFERTWSLGVEPGMQGVERAEVRVEWEDQGPRSFTLVSLLRESE